MNELENLSGEGSLSQPQTPADHMAFYAEHKRKCLSTEDQAIVDALVAAELIRQGAQPPGRLCASLRAQAMRYRLHSPALAAHMDITANHLEKQRLNGN